MKFKLRVFFMVYDQIYLNVEVLTQYFKSLPKRSWDSDTVDSHTSILACIWSTDIDDIQAVNGVPWDCT